MCFFIRQLFIAPLVLAIAWYSGSMGALWFLALAPTAAVAFYSYAWHDYEHGNIDDPIELAELMCGVCSTAMLLPIG